MKLTILQGNTLDLLPTLPSDSIDLCITSPPYWGLRAYGTKGVIIGGNKDCQHEWEENIVKDNGHDNVFSTSTPHNQEAPKWNSPKETTHGKCSKCGAWLGEYGSEPTMEAYLDNTMKWVKEVWRVLKPTGSFVLNIGDCFFTKRNEKAKEQVENSIGYVQRRAGFDHEYGIYKTKQLLSVSSFAYCRIVSETDFVCRGEHIWAKPNVPSPIRSRLKHSHEKLFWFVKDADRYYFDSKVWMKQTTTTTKKRCESPIHYDMINSGGHDRETVKKVPIQEETIEHSWRIVPVGAKQSGFELNGKIASEHIAPYPENLIGPYIKSLCPQDGVVLDPFLGSGTTMRVAMENMRSAIGCELSEKSVTYAKKRLNWEQGLGTEYLEKKED